MGIRINELIAVSQVSNLLGSGQSVDYCRGYVGGLWVGDKINEEEHKAIDVSLKETEQQFNLIKEELTKKAEEN